MHAHASQRRDEIGDETLGSDRDFATSVGMTYIVDLETGEAIYLDPLLEAKLSGSGARFDLQRFRSSLSEDHRHALSAHLAQARSMSASEAAHLVISVPQASGEPAWLHFCSRVLPNPAGQTRQVVGAAVELAPADAAALGKDITRQIRDAEEAERRRIGREMHDSTIQHLVAIGLLLMRLRLQDPKVIDETLDEMQALLDAVQNEMRTFAFLLHPPQVREQGLEQSLRRFTEGFQRRTGLKVALDVQLNRAFLPFDAEISLFRVTQEALMNVHRHAYATQVWIQLLVDSRAATLIVEDDGIGMDSSQLTAAMRGAGVGVASMKARVLQLGGSLRLNSNGRGLQVIASVPRRSRRS